MLRWFGAGLLFTAGAAMATAASAAQTTQTLAVSTKVVPGAAVGFEITAQPLQITASDLGRGYVDVVMKSRMRLATGARSGELKPAVILGIEPRADLFRSFTVASLGEAHPGNGHGNGNGNGNGHTQVAAVPVRLADAPTAATAEFRYRFEFSRSARQGAFETTISVAVDL
jgi:hypothetical protein